MMPMHGRGKRVLMATNWKSSGRTVFGKPEKIRSGRSTRIIYLKLINAKRLPGTGSFFA